MFGKTLLEDKSFMKDGLEQPYLVVKDALLPDFAELLYQELMTTDQWINSDRSSFTAKEQALIPKGYSFTREAFQLESATLPENIKKLYDYLNSDECLQWMTNLSGRQCDDFSGACARYYGGNHLTSHNDYYLNRANDGAITTRAITFNYYLTKDWQSEWGGNFVWEKPYAKLKPTFNTLVLFPVGYDSMHHVEQVNTLATNPRLAFTGWFTATRKAGERRLNLKSR